MSRPERGELKLYIIRGQRGGRFMIDLVGKIVEVETGDMTYTGRLIEIGEDDVYLESESGWIVIPVDRIAFIREL